MPRNLITKRKKDERDCPTNLVNGDILCNLKLHTTTVDNQTMITLN